MFFLKAILPYEIEITGTHLNSLYIVYAATFLLNCVVDIVSSSSFSSLFLSTLYFFIIQEEKGTSDLQATQVKYLNIFVFAFTDPGSFRKDMGPELKITT